MGKAELLAPAGSYESAIAAIQNGCDAVYVGGELFSARAFADNLDRQQMHQLVQYAHSFGVRVYVAINTLIAQSQMKECLSYIEWLQDNDVDALIIQDIGLLMRVASNFPEFEIHASTQMHIHNLSGISFLKKYGVTRVVVPREMSLAQIKALCNQGIEIEVFVHGALCISYSGQCYMSERLLKRSANKGACAQMCRMRYSLYREDNSHFERIDSEGEYLLSPKDLCTIEHIEELASLPISSYKIEGRMKRSSYVAQVVATYRKVIDEANMNKVSNFQPEIRAMKQLFNRGFTPGKLFGSFDNDYIHIQRPNHMGIEIGSVVKIHNDKISIKLTADLHQGDGIRFIGVKEDVGFKLNRLYLNGLLVAKAKNNDIVEIDRTFDIALNSKVIKSSDVLQENQLISDYSKGIRKVPITIKALMFAFKYLEIEVSDGENVVRVQSDNLVEHAHTSPLSSERIKVQLCKVGESIFKVNKIFVESDELGTIPISSLNELRRRALEQLVIKRMLRNNKRIKKPFSPKPLYIEKTNKIIVSVWTLEQYKACKNFTNVCIAICDLELYKSLKMQDPNILYHEPIVQHEDNYPIGIISELGGLSVQQDAICSDSIHVCNSDSAYLLFEQGAKIVCLSTSCNIDESAAIIDDYKSKYNSDFNFMKCIYERQKLMTSEHCVIKNSCKTKENCQLCKGEIRYYIQDENGHNFPVKGDNHCRSGIYDFQVSNNVTLIPALASIGVSNYFVKFTFENAHEVFQVLTSIMQLL